MHSLFLLWSCLLNPWREHFDNPANVATLPAIGIITAKVNWATEWEREKKDKGRNIKEWNAFKGNKQGRQKTKGALSSDA